MKKLHIVALISVLVLGAGGAAHANVCAVDDVPAATLLFPFVVFDFDAYHAGVRGPDTIFSITNMSPEAQIVHVTIWSDFGAPILDFNILLTGYDVVSMKASIIFGGGQLPVTRNQAHSQTEGVRADGPVSILNEPFPKTATTTSLTSSPSMSPILIQEFLLFPPSRTCSLNDPLPSFSNAMIESAPFSSWCQDPATRSISSSPSRSPP